MNKAFKVTVEYICTDMIDEETLKNEFNDDAMLAYKFISDGFEDSVLNFCEDTKDKVVAVDVIDVVT